MIIIKERKEHLQEIAMEKLTVSSFLYRLKHTGPTPCMGEYRTRLGLTVSISSPAVCKTINNYFIVNSRKTLEGLTLNFPANKIKDISRGAGDNGASYFMYFADGSELTLELDRELAQV